MNRRHVTDGLTALAAWSFPKSRRADAMVVRDCAREAIDTAGPGTLVRECLSLAGAGLRARAQVASYELSDAPWRLGLSQLTLPLAAAMLMLWTFGFVPRYDHWPLGEGWALLLGGSFVAVIGAALRARWLTGIGAAATLAAAASPHLGLGTEAALADTPSFFQGYGVDLAAASLPPTLLLAAAAWSLPAGTRLPIRVTLARLALGLLPATISLLALLPAPTPEPTFGLALHGPGSEPSVVVGPPYPMPWIWPSRFLLLAFAVALAGSLIVTWARARTNPAGALASGLVLMSVAYPLVWASIRHLPAPQWAHAPHYLWPLMLLPVLLALTLMRRAGRGSPA